MHCLGGKIPTRGVQPYEVGKQQYEPLRKAEMYTFVYDHKEFYLKKNTILED